MAAIQQVLFAMGVIGQGPVAPPPVFLGDVFLKSSPTSAVPQNAVSNGGSSAGATVQLNMLNTGSLITTLESNGTLSGLSSIVGDSYNWLTGGLGSLYSVRIVTSGDFSRTRGYISDLVNSWLPMTQSRSWIIAAVAGPLPRGGPPSINQNINFTIEIALTSDLNNVIARSGNINFSVSAQTSGESFAGGGGGNVPDGDFSALPNQN
jgi:hypothetical protein